MTDTFDLWLEGELAAGYEPFAAAELPAGAPYRAGRDSVPGPFASRLAGRGAVIVATVFLALAASSVLAAAAFSGSTDPREWSRHFADAIAACGDTDEAGQTSVGACVKAILQPGPGPGHDRSGAGPTTGGPQPAPAPSSQLLPLVQPSEGANAKPAEVPGGKPSGKPSVPPATPPGAPADKTPPGQDKPPSGHGNPPAGHPTPPAGHPTPPAGHPTPPPGKH
jgi:hypothetical protein